MKTARTKLGRLPSRGYHDPETIYEILDSGFLCHVGYVNDGQPIVIPTSYGRKGDMLYLHGSVKSQLIRAINAGQPVCVTVTHLDALVLARSTFHHSMNYRSVVILGTGVEIAGDDEKNAALEVITDNILQGRWAESRQPNANELKATGVVGIPITEASAKIRTGPPGDDKPDYALDIWAGLLPMQTTYGAPIPDPLLKEGIDVAGSVTNLLENGRP